LKWFPNNYQRKRPKLLNYTVHKDPRHKSVSFRI
jgi:hypothetical protein